MQTFDAHLFLGLMNALGSYSMLSPEEDHDVADEFKAINVPRLQSYAETLLQLGMSASLVSLDRLANVMATNGCRASHLVDPSRELAGRISDEASMQKFFSLPLADSALFNFPRRGWEGVIQRFPATVDDVEEAARCLALSRYPASVYHSVQITEVGLIELGRFLKISDPISGWTAVSGALTKVIAKKHQDRTPFERKNFGFLEQVEGTVHGLKNAWRNKISHAAGRLILMGNEFNPETAEEILIATRSFMRRLTDGLPPPKKPRGARRVTPQRDPWDVLG